MRGAHGWRAVGISGGYPSTRTTNNQKGIEMTRVVRNPSGYHSSGRNGYEKATQFGTYVKGFDWTGKWSDKEEPGIIHLFARRGEHETIDIWWSIGGKALPDRLPIYTLAGERIKLRNVSAAAKIAANEPDMSRLGRSVRKQRGRNSNGHTVIPPEEMDDYITSLTGSLPFDHESSDEEIMDALYGRTITWINRVSGQTDSAVVGGNTRHLKVVRNGHDYINFVYPIPQRVLANFGKSNMEAETYGFRSVYLDSIVGVD